jgi:hypothetical protein
MTSFTRHGSATGIAASNSAIRNTLFRRNNDTQHTEHPTSDGAPGPDRGGGNVNDPRYSWRTVCSEDGLEIHKRGEQFKNDIFPIYENLEPDSNMTLERDWHPSKQDSPSISTDEGMREWMKVTDNPEMQNTQ